MAENVYKKLFDEFSPVSQKEWEDLVIGDLKGADYEKRLIWDTIEGIRLKPYYTYEDIKGLDHLRTLPGEFPFVRGKKRSSNHWLVRHDIRVDDITSANSKALDALMKGAESIGFILDESLKLSQKDLNLLLKDICLESAEINFWCEKAITELPQMLEAENASRGGSPSGLHGAVEYDPLGRLLTSGNFNSQEKEIFEDLAEITGYAIRMPRFSVINVNAAIFHNSGGTAIDDLAFAMASAAEYLDRMQQAGVPADQTADKIKFTFAIGSNYFMEIAKLRAARYLWAKVAEAWGLEPGIAGKIVIHAVTSGWNKTIYDPYVNMLRSTTEAMSAVLGGADSLSVERFDKPFRKEPTAFSGRIARNTQLVLKEEAYFDKVADPASGSYYIESLTDSLIAGSWDLFLRVIEMGGLTEAFKQGFIQDRIEDAAARRNNFLASRRDILLGTNQYPDPNERVLNNVDQELVWPSQQGTAEPLARPLKIYRGAQPFEELRLRTEKHPEGVPKVFLITYGNPVMRKARAAFSSGFFGCAGFEIIENAGFDDPVKGIVAALKNNASIIVVCSSDEEYPQIVPAIASELAGRALLVVAGYPKEHLEQLKKEGVRYFIHIRSNVIESLQEFQKELGIK